MPANKNAMTRYKILDDLLSNRYHNYSLDDLTEEVNYRLSEMNPDTNGVVRRTIEKDIFYLEYEGPFLVDIERYTVDAYSKEKQKLILNNVSDMQIQHSLYLKNKCRQTKSTFFQKH